MDVARSLPRARWVRRLAEGRDQLPKIMIRSLHPGDHTVHSEIGERWRET